VLGYALVAETISWVRALRQTLPEARRRRLGLVAFSRQSDDPTTKTVLYEDSAAVVGVLLMAVGVGLFRDAKSLVIGEAAPADERARIRETIERHDEVVEVLDLRTMYLGPGRLMVAARIDLRDDVDAGTIEQLSETIDRELRGEVGSIDHVYLDATSRRRAHARGRRSESMSSSLRQHGDTPASCAGRS
jgi:hypothetical protein